MSTILNVLRLIALFCAVLWLMGYKLALALFFLPVSIYFFVNSLDSYRKKDIKFAILFLILAILSIFTAIDKFMQL